MKNIECFFDGCCEPKNPGGAMGIGSLVKIDGEKVFANADYQPPNESNTNNIAEYLSLEKIIDFILDNGLDSENVIIKGDSQLAIKQMTGEYSMKSGAYIPYAKRCLEKIATFRIPPIFQWIPREQNQEADDLSKSHLLENNIQPQTYGDINVLTFGKYRGLKIADLGDMQYLIWALKNVKLKPAQRDLISSRISQLEFLAK